MSIQNRSIVALLGALRANGGSAGFDVPGLEFPNGSTQIAAGSPSFTTARLGDIVFNQTLDVNSEDDSPKGLYFRSDGLKLYLIGRTNFKINEYDLSVSWDISTAVFLQNFDISTEFANPSDISFNADGTRVFVIDTNSAIVWQYDLSTPWDISTAVVDDFFDAGGVVTTSRGIAFKPDGSVFYLTDSILGTVSRFNLSIDWDVTTAIFDPLIFTPPEIFSTFAIGFRADGVFLYVGDDSNTFYEYFLSTPWDITTAESKDSFTVAPDGASDMYSAVFSTYNHKFYFCDNAADLIYEYSVKTVSHVGTEEVEIFGPDDLPAPSGGVITLPSGSYVLKNDITLAFPIKVDAGLGVEITSIGLGAVITYTGTDPFIQSNPAATFFIFNQVNILLTGNNVELFDTDGPSILIDRMIATFTGTGGGLGTTRNHALAFSLRSSTISGFVDGVSIVNSPLFITGSTQLDSPVAGGTPLFSVDALTDTVQANILTLNAHATDELFDIDASFAGFVTLDQIRNLGGSDFFAAGSLDEMSPRVDVFASPPQKPSKNIGSVIATNNVAVTSITVQSQFEDMDLNATAVIGSNAELWSLSGSTTGELTYDGLTPFDGSLTAAITSISAGASDEFHFRAVKNGSPLSDGVLASNDIGVTAKSTVLVAPITADPGDTIRLQVANNDGTSNITIQQLSMQVS